MSSIFSDPPFRRGTTLLGGEAIELDAAGNPVAGGEIVGSVKVFQDVNPYTGVRYSNRLVYCMAVRYKGSDIAAENIGNIAGRAVVVAPSAPLTDVSSLAVTANVSSGLTVGVFDEYLTGSLRTNDIVWMVVKGPATVVKATGTAITGGNPVEVSASNGTVTANATAGAGFASQIQSFVSGVAAAGGAASADAQTRINVWSQRI